MLETLIRLHGALFACMLEMERLNRGPAPSRENLALVRLNLIRASLDQGSFLEATVYPALQGHLSDTETMQVRRLRREGIDLRLSSSEHVSEWPLDRAIGNWDDYCIASREMRASLRRRVSMEKSVLYSLLSRVAEDNADLGTVGRAA